MLTIIFQSLSFQYNSEEDFNKAYKKVIRRRQKQMDDQNWNIYMESINDTDSKKTFTIENNIEVKQSEHSFNKGSNSHFSTDDSVNVHSLHDPSYLNNIHGLRK